MGMKRMSPGRNPAGASQLMDQSEAAAPLASGEQTIMKRAARPLGEPPAGSYDS
jgi:hypothetical protein